MTEGPALVAERGVTRGLFGALVAFLFLPFPPLFLLGPLAGLLLLGRPATAREWLWIAGALALAIMATAVGARSAAQEVVRAAAASFTGTFLAILLLRPGAPFVRAALAALATAAAVAIGCAVIGLSWEAIRLALQSQLQEAMSLVVDQSGLPEANVAELREMMNWMAHVYPGLAVLGAIGGGSLAVALAARIARQPIVPSGKRLADFRFNDHLVWGAVVTLASFLLPLPDPWADLVLNLLVIWTGLYVARGSAIILTASRRWPTGLTVALFLGAVLLLPYVLSGLLILGLADTWIDIRRALSPPPPGGVVS